METKAIGMTDSNEILTTHMYNTHTTHTRTQHTDFRGKQTSHWFNTTYYMALIIYITYTLHKVAGYTIQESW